MGGRAETAGPGGHPRCIWLAVNTCPHLVEHDDPDDTIAWLYVGDGVGYLISPDQLENEYGHGEEIIEGAEPLTRAALRVLAKQDPLGTSAGVAA